MHINSRDNSLSSVLLEDFKASFTLDITLHSFSFGCSSFFFLLSLPIYNLSIKEVLSSDCFLTLYLDSCAVYLFVPYLETLRHSSAHLLHISAHCLQCSMCPACFSHSSAHASHTSEHSLQTCLEYSLSADITSDAVAHA
jgi:hypothetical protein